MVAAFVFPSWQVKETSGMSLLSGPSRVLVIFVGVIEDPKPIQRGGRQGRGAEEWNGTGFPRKRPWSYSLFPGDT